MHRVPFDPEPHLRTALPSRGTLQSRYSECFHARPTSLLALVGIVLAIDVYTMPLYQHVSSSDASELRQLRNEHDSIDNRTHSEPTFEICKFPEFEPELFSARERLAGIAFRSCKHGSAPLNYDSAIASLCGTQPNLGRRQAAKSHMLAK